MRVIVIENSVDRRFGTNKGLLQDIYKCTSLEGFLALCKEHFFREVCATHTCTQTHTNHNFLPIPDFALPAPEFLLANTGSQDITSKRTDDAHPKIKQMNENMLLVLPNPDQTSHLLERPYKLDKLKSLRTARQPRPPPPWFQPRTRKTAQVCISFLYLSISSLSFFLSRTRDRYICTRHEIRSFVFLSVVAVYCCLEGFRSDLE